MLLSAPARSRVVRLTVATALAAGGLGVAGSAPAAAGESPSQICGPADLFEIVYTNPRTGAVELYEKPTATHGGCVSSTVLGAGQLSTAALTAQCRRIENRFAIDYPFSFYGKFEAKNRAGCIEVMRGLSTGTLDSGLPTPFPF